MICRFQLRVHLTSKSKMAPFDLYRKYRKVEELDLFCMYVDENLHEGVFGAGKSNRDLRFSFRSRLDLQIQDGGL